MNTPPPLTPTFMRPEFVKAGAIAGLYGICTSIWIMGPDFFLDDDVLYLMEDMATGEIRLSILWEWLHKGARLTEDDPETGARAGDLFTTGLFERLLAEEHAKLLAARDKDVYDVSKQTTLPIALAIASSINPPPRCGWIAGPVRSCPPAPPGCARA